MPERRGGDPALPHPSCPRSATGLRSLKFSDTEFEPLGGSPCGPTDCRGGETRGPQPPCGQGLTAGSCGVEHDFCPFLCLIDFKATFHFCSRLKEIIFKERNSKVQLELMVRKLQSEIKKLTVELMKARDQQDDHVRHLRSLERALEKVERQKGQQQAAQVRVPVLRWRRLAPRGAGLVPMGIGGQLAGF